MLKLTTDKHEASRSLSATAELLVYDVIKTDVIETKIQARPRPGLHFARSRLSCHMQHMLKPALPLCEPYGRIEPPIFGWPPIFVVATSFKYIYMHLYFWHNWQLLHNFTNFYLMSAHWHAILISQFCPFVHLSSVHHVPVLMLETSMDV